MANTIGELKMIRDILEANHRHAAEHAADAPDDEGALEAIEGRGAALRVAIRALDSAAADFGRRIAQALEGLPPAPGDPSFQAAYIETMRKTIAALREGRPAELLR